MTWTETHRRWQALSEIEALANASESDELPWNAEYAAIFGDRASLAEALQYRWDLNRNTQLDSQLPEDVFAEQRRRLISRNAGVLRVLEHHRRASHSNVVTVIPVQRATGETSPTRVPA